MLVPATTSIGTPARSSAASTPMCAKPFALPPLRTRPMRGRATRDVVSWASAMTCEPQRAQRTQRAPRTTDARVFSKDSRAQYSPFQFASFAPFVSFVVQALRDLGAEHSDLTSGCRPHHRPHRPKSLGMMKNGNVIRVGELDQPGIGPP